MFNVSFEEQLLVDSCVWVKSLGKIVLCVVGGYGRLKVSGMALIFTES